MIGCLITQSQDHDSEHVKTIFKYRPAIWQDCRGDAPALGLTVTRNDGKMATSTHKIP
jgi:hypothetical protein